MDQPLFGEKKTSTKAFQWVLIVVVAGYSLFTFLMAFIFGFKYSHKNFAWAALVVVVFAFVSWMFMWWRNESDVAPTVNYLVLFAVFCLIFVCSMAHVYVWTKPPPPPPPPQCPNFSCIANSSLIVNGPPYCLYYNPSTEALTVASNCVIPNPTTAPPSTSSKSKRISSL